MPDTAISVSEIVRASICPMQLYLASSDPKGFTEPVRYSAAKQLSCHLGDTLCPAQIREELAFSLPDADDEAYRILDEMIAACKPVQFRKAEACDVSVASEKYNIHGRIDRFFNDGFAIVKGGAAPPHGVYAADRLQAVCYALCLEEMYGREFSASVEYLGSGTIRQVVFSPSDRRVFLEALRTAERVRRGEIPRAVRGTLCKKCRFEESCRPLERPLSLFERMKKKRE